MMEHHYSHRREKSSLRRFLTWLTILSLTSFFFHPDGMIWIILHWSVLQTQRLLHHTVELCGYDTANSIALLWAALGWFTSALLSAWYLLHKLFPVKQMPLRVATPVDSGFDFSHLKGGKKAKRKEKKSRAIYLSQRDGLTPPSSPRISTPTNAFCYSPPSHYTSSLPSPKKVAQARQPESNLTLHVVTKPVTTELKSQNMENISIPPPSPVKSNDQKLIEATLPADSLCNPVDEPECSPTADPTPLEYQSPIEEPTPIDEIDEELPEEPLDDLENNEVRQDIVEEKVVEEIHVEKDQDEEIEETPEAPRVFSKAELFAFLRDPKTTAPAIRHCVANGLIDGDMVLSMHSSEFAEAKVSQLAARMLFISVMSSRENRYPPTPTYNRAVVSPPSRVPPPPGFSAINNLPSNDYYRSAGRRFDEPVKNTLDMNHQYERDMELISNQMTMNVLD